MVENGRVRGAEYSVGATLERWRELLEPRLPALWEAGHGRRLRRLPLGLRALLRRLLDVRPRGGR